MPRQSTAPKKPRSPRAHPDEGNPAREVAFEWLCDNLEAIGKSLFDMPQSVIDSKLEEGLQAWREEARSAASNLKGYLPSREVSPEVKAALRKRIAQIQGLVRSTKPPRSKLSWGSASLLEWNPAAAISLVEEVGPASRKRSETRVAAYVDVAATYKVVKRFAFQPVPGTLGHSGFHIPIDRRLSGLLEAGLELPKVAAATIKINVWFDVRVGDFRVADLLRELRDLESLNPDVYIVVVTDGEINATPRRLLEQAGFGVVERSLGRALRTSSFGAWLPD